MRGYSLKTYTGGIQAGETTHLFRSLPKITTTRPVILLHGSGAAYQYADATRWHSLRYGPYLARAGWNSVAGAMGGQTWANDTAMSRVTSAIDYIKAQFGLTGKVHLIGGSMGGAVGLRYAILNPTEVASYTGLIPLTDLTSYYNGLAAGAAKDEISTAWGVASGAALPAAANIANLASGLNGVVKSRLYYADDDPTVLPTWVTTVGASMGAELINVGSLGHTEAALGAALDKTGDSSIINFLTKAEASA